jgi:hypothetical protein
VSTHDITQDRGATAAHGRPTRSGALRRLATETKAAFKTTEFYAFLAVLAGLLVTGHTIEGKDGGAARALGCRLDAHSGAHAPRSVAGPPGSSGLGA